MTRRRHTGESGFTLVEVILATVVISVGLVAVATGFQFATSGVASGRGETTAAFLAEQRVEQLKARAIADYFNDAALAQGTITEYCQSSNIGVTGTNCQTTPFTGAPAYTRVTRILDNPGGSGCTGVAPFFCKRIHVSVTYRPVTSAGDVSQQRQVDLYALVAPRT